VLFIYHLKREMPRLLALTGTTVHTEETQHEMTKQK